MLALGPSLGCPEVNGQPDVPCLCKNTNFGYGIRDCSAQSCPSGTDLNAIYNFALQECAAGESRGGQGGETEPRAPVSFYSREKA